MVVYKRKGVFEMGDRGTKSILVVEDEPKIGEVCSRVLTSEGFTVDIAVNGSVAQEMLTQKDYDLCLIDIRMPVMNGKELFQVIVKRYPRLAGGGNLHHRRFDRGRHPALSRAHR
jgi:CheY-like chemotaxis protein